MAQILWFKDNKVETPWFSWTFSRRLRCFCSSSPSICVPNSKKKGALTLGNHIFLEPSSRLLTCNLPCVTLPPQLLGKLENVDFLVGYIAGLNNIRLLLGKKNKMDISQHLAVGPTAREWLSGVLKFSIFLNKQAKLSIIEGSVRNIK